tara:strand:- start:908 stop:1156 length:249 start_codon:yes stop_codon:yes gene_type:complete
MSWSTNNWSSVEFEPTEVHICDFGLEGDLQITITRVDSHVTNVSLDNWTLYRDEDDSVMENDKLARELFDEEYLISFVESQS